MVIQQISGWNFDTEKFYKNDVRLETSTELKGLAVKTGSLDVLKVGDFTNATEAYYTSSMPNAPVTSSGWVTEADTYSLQFGWITQGKEFGAFDDFGVGYSNSQFRTYLALPISDIAGKTISVRFGIAEQENAIGDNKLTPVWAYIETNVGTFALQDVTPTNSVYLIGNTVTYEERSLVVNIPSDATYARLYFAWYVNTDPFYPASVLLQNYSFDVYDKTMVELNKLGLKIYNSPVSSINLNNNKASFNLSEISAGNKLSIGNWSFSTEPYLEGDGVTLNERLTLKYKDVAKGYFSSDTGAYTTA